MPQFRANLVACLHSAQKQRNIYCAQAWNRALRAYDAKNVDSLNFWIRAGAVETGNPAFMKKAKTVAPITLEGLLAYEKEQLYANNA